jgi:hypothetical protein
MRLKQALIDLGYKHPDLRPHLRKILASTLSEEVLNEVRRLEDGKTNDPRQWETVYRLLLQAKPKLPLVRVALERIAKVRDGMRGAPRRVTWGLGGFAQMVAQEEHPLHKFPYTVVKKSGSDLTLLRFEDGSYLLRVDTGWDTKVHSYPSKSSAMSGFRNAEDDWYGDDSYYDIGFEEEDLYDREPSDTEPTQEDLDYLDSLEPDWL